MAKKIQVDLQARTDKANRDIKKFADKSKNNFDKLKKSSNSASKSMMAGWKKAVIAVAGVTAAILVVGKSIKVIKRLTMSTLDYADSIAKAANMLGISTDALQKYNFIAGQSGVETSILKSSLIALTKRIGEAKAGTGALITFLKKYDEGLLKQIKNSKSTEDAFELIMKAINSTSNSFDKAALASAAFSRAGVPLINMAGNFETLKKKAEDLGLVIDEELLKNAEKTKDSFDVLSKVIKTRLMSAILKLAPELTKIADKMSNWIANNKELINQKVPEYIDKIKDSLKKISDIYDSLPEGVVGAAGAGIIGRMLFGATIGKIVAVFVLVNEQLKKLKLNITRIPKESEGAWKAMKNIAIGIAVAIKKIREGTLTWGELIRLNYKEFEALLEKTKEYGKITVKISKEELENSKKIDEAIKNRINSTNDLKDSVDDLGKSYSIAVQEALALQKAGGPVAWTGKTPWAAKEPPNVYKDYERAKNEYKKFTMDKYEYAKEALHKEYLSTIQALKETMKDRKMFLIAAGMAWDAYGEKIKLLNAKRAKEIKDKYLESERDKLQKAFEQQDYYINLAAENQKKVEEEVTAKYVENAFKKMTASEEAAKKAAAPWIELGNIIQNNMENLAVSAMDNFITRVTEGGDAATQLKFLIGDMARSICLDITRMIAKMLILKAIQTSMGWLSGLGGGGIVSPKVTSGDMGYANAPSFAEGGVATGPQSGYLAKLHGTELITPLDKGSKVAATNSITNNITVNVQGGGSEKDDQKTGSKIATLIGNEVDKRIANQLRPGGILNRNIAGGR